MAFKAFILSVNSIDLKYCSNDGDRLKKSLEKYGYEITSMQSGEVHDFIEQFNFFIDEAKQTDTLLLYFSGHARIEKSRLWFVLSEQLNRQASKLNINESLEIFANCHASSKLVILDCCHAGMAVEGLQLPLAELRYMIFASSEKLEKSKELELFKASFFTYYLCNALDYPPSELLERDNITAHNLFNWLKQKAIEHNKQYPNTQVPIPVRFGAHSDFTLATLPAAEEANQIGNDESLVYQRVDYHKLVEIDGDFLNRLEELKFLDDAWADKERTNIVIFVATHGVGKTSVVKRWLIYRLKPNNWGRAERILGWSFYPVGTRDNPKGSEDVFFNYALRFFGVSYDPKELPWEKGRKLAVALSKQRSLLILDGVESLQNPPDGPEGSKLRTQGLQYLLSELATNGHPGLCLITTHYPIKDLDEYGPEAGVIVRKLDYLDEDDGARLLHRLGVNRAGDAYIEETDDELRQASREVHGHALTLKLLGHFLRQAYLGDVRKRYRVKLNEVDTFNHGKTFRMISAYEEWLSSSDDGVQQLAVLRLMSLFNGSADIDSLKALCHEPPIPGLTESLVGLTDIDWNIIISRLCENDLIFPPRDKPRTDATPIEYHALLGDYFATTLRKDNFESYKEAHRRLYMHFQSKPLLARPDLNALIPFYRAVVHGCCAGCTQDAYDNVYIQKINRCTFGEKAYYASSELGAYNADFVAVSCFFRRPWTEFLSGLNDLTKMELLIQASRLLHVLGHVTETREPLEHAHKVLSESLNDWKMKAEIAIRLCITEWRLGHISEAKHAAKEAVKFSYKGGDNIQIVVSKVQYLNALHLTGNRKAALVILNQIDDMRLLDTIQDKWIHYMRIYDVLLADVERICWLKLMGAHLKQSQIKAAKEEIKNVRHRIEPLIRATKQSETGVRTKGFYNLVLGRISLYSAQLFSGRYGFRELKKAQNHLEQAVTNLSSMGVGAIPLGVIPLAWLRRLDDKEEPSIADLNKAWQAAERGGMTLHLINILLYRARLFFRRKPYPWKSPREDLVEARKLLERCCYWRRKKELEDAEALIMS